MNETDLSLLDSEINKVSSRIDEYTRKRDSTEKEFEHYTQTVKVYNGILSALNIARALLATS